MLIDIKNAAQILGIKTSTLYFYAEVGLVPVVHVGRLLRFEQDSLLNHFKTGEFQRLKEKILKSKK